MTNDFVWDEPMFPDDNLDGALEFDDDAEVEMDDELEEIFPLDEEDDEYVSEEEFAELERGFTDED